MEKTENFKMSAATVALQTQLQQKAGELKSFMDANKDAATGTLKHESLKAVRDRDAELNEIGAKLAAAREMDAIEAKAADLGRLPQPSAHQHSKGGPEEPGTGDFKTLSELFLESEAYKSFEQNPRSFTASLKASGIPGLDMTAMKTLVTTSAGFAPANNRGPVVVPFAIRRTMVEDMIPQDATVNSVIRYMQETTFTNSAAGVAEGAVKPESASAFTEVQAPLQAIAHTLPVTEQQLRYVPQIRAILDDRMVVMLKLAVESQLLNGTGAAPQLSGFLTTSGVQTYAEGTNAGENIVDAFYRGITKVRSIGFAEPDGNIINPNDWVLVRLLKTTQGAYIYGNPDEAGPERMWGKPVAITTAMTAGTGLTGDFGMYSHIDHSLDYTVEVGWVNDDFKRNQKTLRAEKWLTLEIYRPSAFCKITALA